MKYKIHVKIYLNKFYFLNKIIAINEKRIGINIQKKKGIFGIKFPQIKHKPLEQMFLTFGIEYTFKQFLN